MKTNMTARIDDKVAVFEQSHPSKLPLVSPGVLTPSVWAEIKRGLREFCLHKKIPEEDRAKMVIAAFRDVEIAEDLENNYDEVVKLSLDALMNRIWDNFMPKDWADAVSNQLLLLRMATDTTFLSHYNTALSRNLMLKGTDLFLDDRAFINQLKATIPNELFSRARDEGLTREYNLKAFKSGLVEVDKRRLNDRKRIRDEAEDIAQKRFGSSAAFNRQVPPTATRPRTAGPPPSTTFHGNPLPNAVRLKALTERERAYLMETRGCLKCRQPNTSHRASDCPNGFPDPTFVLHIPTSFKASTLPSASTTPKPAYNSNTAEKNRTKPVAAFVDSNWAEGESGDDEVAAVLPSAVIEDPSNDSDPTLNVSTYHSRHYRWKCTVVGPKVKMGTTVDALIDCGAHLTLISPGLVEYLGLRVFKLHRPETVSVALASVSKSSVSLSHYVNLAVSSTDGEWSSVPIVT
ncbi:hypothetical protein C0991_009383, partial [Blastosporella zonata]